MKPSQITVKPDHYIFRFILLLLVRFFITGAHLTGQKYNDATFLHDARHFRYPHDTWWKRKAGWRRAAWRNAIFWPTVLLVYLFWFYTSSMLFLLASCTPFLLWLAWPRVRRLTHKPILVWNDGIPTQSHMWHPKIRKLFSRKSRPGTIRSDLLEDPVPPEVAKVIMAENADAGRSPITSLKRIRR